MRSRPRLDANHLEICQALNAVGASVQSLAALGGGCPDLLVAYRNRTFVLELKTETGTLTKAQESWLLHWQGPVSIVRDANGALRAIGARQ